MLSEIKNARQIPGEGRRRWFRDEELDLIVWYDDDDAFVGFQLCYNKLLGEKALTWKQNGSYQHNAIDDGEVPWGNKMSPILVADGTFDKARVAAIFKEKSTQIEGNLVELVLNKLTNYPT